MCRGLIASLALLLSACAIYPDRVGLTDRRGADLNDTPFFAQTEYHCGPAALATVLGASGVEVEPGELIPRIYTPGREGTLQTDVIAATRVYARAPYVIDPDPEDLLDELDAGRPVLVFQNLGLKSRPVWHYAVAVAYDPDLGKIYLRSGKTRRKAIGMGKFLRTWERGGQWALVALKPGELPANPDSRRLLEAIVAMETIHEPDDMTSFYRGFLGHYPDDSVAKLGLANAYLNNSDLGEAIALYRAILVADPGNVAAANNLAIALSRAGCVESAEARAQNALKAAHDSNTFVSEAERTLDEVATHFAAEPGKSVKADLCDPGNFM